MVKYKILSSLELLNLSKPRVTLILKEVIDNLLQISSSCDCESLHDFNLLCTQLKNKRVNDISSFLSENIIDYDVNLNKSSDTTFADIRFTFNNTFPVNKLNIKNLRL